MMFASESSGRAPRAAGSRAVIFADIEALTGIELISALAGAGCDPFVVKVRERCVNV